MFMQEDFIGKVFVYKDLLEMFLAENPSNPDLISGVIRVFLSKNCSCSEHNFSHVFLYLNDILNLKEFRIFKG
jgi:hypothetical protein